MKPYLQMKEFVVCIFLCFVFESTKAQKNIHETYTSQENYVLKHTYKVRLRTGDNKLQRGIVTSIDDSTITVLWHVVHKNYNYTDIDRINVFRKGTVGKVMLATVPLSIAGGLAISRNQPTPNNATRWLNNFAAVTLGFTAGIVEAALIGKLLRKTYYIQGERSKFCRLLNHITSD